MIPHIPLLNYAALPSGILGRGRDAQDGLHWLREYLLHPVISILDVVY